MSTFKQFASDVDIIINLQDVNVEFEELEL